jgi:acetylornithine deacetylase/succinyl-diaminopimelate desuccinylase-like protein
MAEMAELIRKRLSRLGVEPEIIVVDNSYPYLYAEVGQGRRTLLLYNHYDIQPVNGEQWSVDPFGAEICVRDGKQTLIARGVADNKANLLFRIQAIESYLKVYGQLPLRVKFLIEGEEEIGSPHLPQFVEQYRDRLRADGCIWESGRKDASGRPLICLGLKGILYVELETQTAQTDIHSSWGTLLPNAAWRLVEALATLRDKDSRPKIDGLYDYLQSPSEADLKALETLPFNTETFVETYGLKKALVTSGSTALRQHLFEPTINICGLESGYMGKGIKTILPYKARAKLDLRLPPGLIPETVLKLLRAHLTRRGFDDIEVKPILGELPAKSPVDAPIVRAVTEAVKKSYKVEPAVWPLMAASGPMYYLCDALSIPSVTFGAGHEGDNAHGVDEHILLDNYREALEAFGEIIEQFARS